MLESITKFRASKASVIDLTYASYSYSGGLCSSARCWNVGRVREVTSNILTNIGNVATVTTFCAGFQNGELCIYLDRVDFLFLFSLFEKLCSPVCSTVPDCYA